MNKRESVIEVELDTLRLLVVGALLLSAVAAAFYLGRWSAPAATDVGAAADASVATGPASEQQLAGETLFDAAGQSGVVREPGRQLTAEPSRRGQWEVQVGRSAGRKGAERLEQACRKAGVPALVVRDADGAYRVLGGPFGTQREARRAAGEIGQVLGREVSVARSTE